MILSSALHLLWHTALCVRVCVCSLCPVCESAETPKRKQDQLRLNRITNRLFFFFFGGPVQNLQSTQEQKASIFLRLNESCWVFFSKELLLHTTFCGQRVPFGCVATFVLGYKSHSVAGLNTLTLTVMLCSSHAVHPSFPNTIPTSLRRLVYGTSPLLVQKQRCVNTQQICTSTTCNWQLL